MTMYAMATRAVNELCTVLAVRPTTSGAPTVTCPLSGRGYVKSNQDREGANQQCFNSHHSVRMEILWRLFAVVTYTDRGDTDVFLP